MRIVIDGNIGSGKTTLLKRLKNEGYTIKQEAIEEWPLDQFYKDPERWTFTLQLAIIKSMGLPPDGTIHERCIQSSNHVFFRLLKDEYTFSNVEIELYKYFYDKHVWKPDLHIYLNATPEKCFQNIKQRCQTGDAYISLDYLKKVDHYYSQFVKNNPNIINIDADQDEDTVFKNICNLLVCQQS